MPLQNSQHGACPTITSIINNFSVEELIQLHNKEIEDYEHENDDDDNDEEIDASITNCFDILGSTTDKNELQHQLSPEYWMKKRCTFNFVLRVAVHSNNSSYVVQSSGHRTNCTG